MITDIETLKSIIPTVIGDSIERYQSSLINADRWLAINVTGFPLLDFIKSDSDSQAFKLAQFAVAYKGYYDAIPMLDLVENENGFAVVNDQTLLPASTARVEALRKLMADMLSSSVDQLQSYLEENEQFHQLWKKSDTCTIISDSLLPTMSMYRRYGQFVGTRVDFLKSRSIFISIIRSVIEPRVSPELVAEIIEQTNSNTLTEANLKVADHLRYALSASFAKDGNFANACLSSVCRILDAFPSDYPAWESSDLYQSKISYKPAERSPGIGIFV